MDYNITCRRKDKGWQYIISYKLNGKWNQKAKQGFATKKEADREAKKKALELSASLKENHILNTDYADITFKTLSDLFIEHNKMYKEYNTIEKYKNAQVKFEYLHDFKVKDIKKMHIQKAIDDLTSEGLKSKTINTYVTQLKLMFKYYTSNYDESFKIDFDNISIPKITIKEKTALTKDQLDILLTKLKTIDDDVFIISLIAGTCGLRIGEIEGLTWNDIDSKNLILNVNKQWKRLKDGTVGFGVLKNNLIRTVPLPASTLEELLKYKNIHITDINNRIIISNKFTLSNKVNRILKKNAKITIHELRHTYATLLISSGVDFKTAAKILGHNVEQTMKTYSHVNDDMMKNAINKISNIF